jgi:hypothetical protein
MYVAKITVFVVVVEKLCRRSPELTQSDLCLGGLTKDLTLWNEVLTNHKLLPRTVDAETCTLELP